MKGGREGDRERQRAKETKIGNETRPQTRMRWADQTAVSDKD